MGINTKNGYTYDHTKHRGQVNLQPSKTQPDMTMGLHELLTRFTKGQAVPIIDPTFEGTDETLHEDFQTTNIEKLSPPEMSQFRMDLAEQIAIKESLVQTAKEATTSAKATIKKTQKEKETSD